MKILSDNDYKDLVGVLKSANSTIETLRRMNTALIDMLEKERTHNTSRETSKKRMPCELCKYSIIGEVQENGKTVKSYACSSNMACRNYESKERE